jgi:hypothetical protein
MSDPKPSFGALLDGDVVEPLKAFAGRVVGWFEGELAQTPNAQAATAAAKQAETVGQQLEQIAGSLVTPFAVGAANSALSAIPGGVAAAPFVDALIAELLPHSSTPAGLAPAPATPAAAVASAVESAAAAIEGAPIRTGPL